MKKAAIGVILGALVVAGLVTIVLYKPIAAPTPEAMDRPATDTQSATGAEITPANTAPGRYVAYEPSALANKGYNETILFFYAPWCPECRAFEQAVESDAIPDGVQILKVDYDSSTELKKKYGVTLQTTFVKVNAAGDKLSSWVGYGKEKSVTVVLENT